MRLLATPWLYQLVFARDSASTRERFAQFQYFGYSGDLSGATPFIQVSKFKRQKSSSLLKELFVALNKHPEKELKSKKMHIYKSLLFWFVSASSFNWRDAYINVFGRSSGFLTALE